MFMCKWRHRRKAEVEWCARRTARFYPQYPNWVPAQSCLPPNKAEPRWREASNARDKGCSNIDTLCQRKTEKTLFTLSYTIQPVSVRLSFPFLLTFSFLLSLTASSSFDILNFTSLNNYWRELDVLSMSATLLMPNHFLLVLRKLTFHEWAVWLLLLFHNAATNNTLVTFSISVFIFKHCTIFEISFPYYVVENSLFATSNHRISELNGMGKHVKPSWQ